MSNANLKVTEGMVLTSSTLQAVHNEILQGRTLDTLPEISETALKTEMEPKVQNLLISSKNSIAELKKEVERMKININLFSKNLDLEKRFRKLETITPTERDHVLNAVQTFNEQNNAHILNFHAELTKLEQQYLLQDQKFTQIFNAYCLYVLQQQQAHKQDIKTAIDTMEAQQTVLNAKKSVTQHFSRLAADSDTYNSEQYVKLGGAMLQNGDSPWNLELNTYTCPETGIYEFHFNFTGKGDSYHFDVWKNNKKEIDLCFQVSKEFSQLHWMVNLVLQKNDFINIKPNKDPANNGGTLTICGGTPLNTTVTYWPT
ncbi:C1q-like domain-containing protein [Spirobacillus cienkowskii]|uniref:C1q-like domain-containing protein n=1 Tax=Spirobacillus cienkowskii TaxID=495820 RepID=UPI0030D1E27C